ncbi:MAG: hypothetical protein VKK04_18690 [Synechococcales bacterium]|nr:hypothetical protein [Synechococcales bacterium]
MEKTFDEAQSLDLGKQIDSKAKQPFDNAHRGALVLKEAVYVQGFLVVGRQPISLREHAWLEVGDRIIDPNFQFLHCSGTDLHYFAAQTLTSKQLKAAVEEANEDYPDDPPLPVYGPPPYEYYGDVMLGGKAYLEAQRAAAAKCQDLMQPGLEEN